MRLFFTAIINNYQKGVTLKSTPTDKIVQMKQIDKNHHRVVYALGSTREAQSVAKILSSPVRQSTPEEIKEAVNAEENK